LCFLDIGDVPFFLWLQRGTIFKNL